MIMIVLKKNLKSLMMILLLIPFILMDAALCVAEQYYCQAAYDICNYQRTTLTLNVGCMNSESWVCTRTVGGKADCVAGSLTKKPSQAYWDKPKEMCQELCGVCTSGWSSKPSGGSGY